MSPINAGRTRWLIVAFVLIGWLVTPSIAQETTSSQRVAIARGLMLQPQYMLLDEPTSALDARTTGEFSQWLSELQEDTSFIIVTHDLPFAAEVASHGVFLEAGQVKATGNVQEIIEKATQSA